MKLFTQLDQYLLHHFPSIWITRVHSFLPIGFLLALVLFLLTTLIGWKPYEDLPTGETAIILMIIPVLIYLVWWFIFQSRYNVAKSGGQMKLGLEYLNFFLYLSVFFVALILILAIPLGNAQRVKNAIDVDKLAKDINALNAGNAFFNNAYSVVFSEDGKYITYSPMEFTTSWAYYEEYAYEVPLENTKTVTVAEAMEIIQAFIDAYNVYSPTRVSKNPAEILAGIRSGIDYQPLVNYDDYYGDNSWMVQYKLTELEDRSIAGWFHDFSEPWFWKIALGLMAFCALLVWIFKQMLLRQFILGFIALCLTPLFVGIVAVILFELLRVDSEEETVGGIILFFYLIFGLISVYAYQRDTLHRGGYILTMYLHFFIPLLPFFIWLTFFDTPFDIFYNGEQVINFLYYSCWITGLASIAIFRPLYRKFRSLPSKN